MHPPTFILRQHSKRRKLPSQCYLKSPQTECPSLQLPVHLSIHEPDFLLLSSFFSYVYSWLLAKPLEILFLIFKQKGLEIKGVC